MGDPFLDIDGFTELWDGPALTDAQQQQVEILLQVASDWIYARVPTTISATDPAAQLVTYEVTAAAVRYGRYTALSSFHRATGHRIDAGTLDKPASALDFTDRHKQLLGIPLRGSPAGTFSDNDFNDPTVAGWPTPRSPSRGTLGYYTYPD